MTNEQIEIVRNSLKQKRYVIFKLNARNYKNCGDNIKAYTIKSLTKWHGITKKDCRYLHFISSDTVEHQQMEVMFDLYINFNVRESWFAISDDEEPCLVGLGCEKTLDIKQISAENIISEIKKIKDIEKDLDDVDLDHLTKWLESEPDMPYELINKLYTDDKGIEQIKCVDISRDIITKTAVQDKSEPKIEYEEMPLF